MKRIFGLVLLASQMIWAQSAIVGQWKTIDDETGKPKSIIEIFEKDGSYNGKIIKLFLEPTEEQNPKCDKCSGEKKDQLVLGMQNLNGLKKDSDTHWSGGEVLDPKNGKTYSCKAEVLDGGKKLKLRGFIGISLLGRTQTWEKVEPVAEAPAPSAEPAQATAASAASAVSEAKPVTVKATPTAKPKKKKKKQLKR